MTAKLKVSDALSFLKEFKDWEINLTIGSPPYLYKGNRYRNDLQSSWANSLDSWVSTMKEITKEALRATSGYVVWVVNNPVVDSLYIPGSEILLVELYREGIQVERPIIWKKNCPPNRKNWFANCWEDILVFRSGGETFNWESIAHPPKYKSGGKFRQRDSKGERKVGGSYPQGKLARPRDVLEATVGGGQMGSPLAHEGLAPFPVSLITPLVLALTETGQLVVDCFVGSGSTMQSALECGRRFAGCDIREDQIALSQRRLEEVERGRLH